MASLVLGIVGNMIVPGIGGLIGSAIGSVIDASFQHLPDQHGPRLSDLKVQTSAYGSGIPINYGTVRQTGNVIWSADLREHTHTETSGGKGGPSQTTTTYTYTVSAAVSLGEGPITGVRRIWADSTLIYDASGANSGAMQMDGLQLKVYRGSETQLPDPTIESYLGAGNVPGYRGQAYVVFTDFPLEKFGNRIPNWSFEVVGKGAVTDTIDVFTYSSDIGGDTLVYNPLRNEVWSVMSSTQAGFNRIDPATGASVGTVSSASAAASVESGIFANPQYDPVNQVIYVMGYGPRVLLKFDAATATFIEGIPWADGLLQYFAVSPITGNVWAVVGDNAHGRLQERDAISGALLRDIPVPDNYDAEIVFDKAGNPWLNASTWVKRYNWAETSSFDFTYVDPDGVNHIVYDKDRNSIWLSTGTNTSSYYTTGSITGVSHGNPCEVTYSVSSGPGFIDGSQVRIVSTGVTQLDDKSYTMTVIDPTHFTIGIDSTNFDPYASGGVILGPYNKIKELSIDSLSIVRTVNVDTDAYGLTIDMLYDTVHRVLWAINDGNGPMLTGINTSDGSIWKKIDGPPYYYMFWPAMAGDNIWVNDSSYETLERISLDRLAPASVALSDVVSDISVRAGLTTGDINVTQLADLVDGYTISRQTDARSCIDQLRQAYFFDAVEDGVKLKFIKRGGSPVVTIPPDELAARHAGEAMPDPINIVRKQEVELPKALNVVYLGSATDYQQATQESKRLVGASGHAVTVQLPIAMSDDKGRQVAETLMLNAWNERTAYQFQTTKKYAAYEPTDVMVVAGHPLRVTKRDDAGGCIIKWEGVAEDSAIYTQTVAGVPANSTTQTISNQGPSKLLLLDIPILRDADNDAGFYATASGYAGFGTWPGAELFKSIDNGSSYLDLLPMLTGATWGICNTALGDFTGNTYDETNTLTLTLANGTVASSTDMVLLNGANAFLVASGSGWEVIQAMTATLNGDGTYTLSRLLRGRKGTEWATAGHAVGDIVIALSSSALRRITASSSELSLARLYKAVTLGTTLQAASAQSFSDTGVGLKPFAPVLLGGGRNAAGDVTINWMRRTRIGGAWNGFTAPLGEASESYDVEIWDSAYAALKRTFPALSTPAVTYTSAQQTTDFGGNQATVYVRVFQNSATVGRGYQLQGTV